MSCGKYHVMKSGPVRQGFVATIIVLSLLVFAAVLVLGATYLSIGEAQVSLATSKGWQVLDAAEGCAENALLLSLRDALYEGGQYDFFGAACDVSVSADVPRYVFSVSAEKDGFVRQIEVSVDREDGPQATFSSPRWLEQ